MAASPRSDADAEGNGIMEASEGAAGFAYYADERTCVGGYQYVSPLAHGRRWSDRTAAARAPRLQGHIRA
jgi:hypothetical protein